MQYSLNEIKAPVAVELEVFEKKFRESMRSKVALLDKITYYIVKRKGKQIRPLFVFLCAKLCGKVTESTHRAASLVELVHTATLVHDDVVDDADRRRGFFSINALWKNKIAVLVGDYLLSRGLLLALDNEDYQLLQIVSTAVKQMSEGELLQMEKARRLDIDESVYFEIIKQKTASLIGAACSAGCASSNGEGIDQIERARLLGEKIGLAFQIKDDLLDYGDSDIGKPKGIDIKEKKLTLPLIHVLQKVNKSDKDKIIRTIKKHHDKKEKVREIIEMVKAKNGLAYARDKMESLRDEALAILNEFPESDSRTALYQLIHFVIDRKK